MNCIAVDDEPLALEILKGYISKCPELLLEKVFDDAIEASSYLQTHGVDLLFVDIDMPDLSGLDLVAKLDPRPLIIFTTAHKRFAHDGFELEALDFLLKPFDFERFERAVNKALKQRSYESRVEPAAAESIVVRSEYKMVKIALSDIVFIEAMEDYVKIHLTSSSHPVLTLMTLKGIMEILPTNRFRRIHRSYVVAVNQVKSIQNKKVRLDSGKELPVSDSYLDFLADWKRRR